MRKFASAVALALLALACDAPEIPLETPSLVGSPVQGGTVVVGLLSDIQGWNPYFAEDSATDNLLALIYPSLAVEQTDYNLHPPSFAPALATGWSWSADHMELTLDLDPDALWSDGVPITSRDVVFTWRAQTSPEIDWIFASAKEFIDSVVALDDHRVKVTFNRRYSYQFMDLNDGLILPAHAWGAIPFDQWASTDWSRHVVAGGPFTLVKHTPQQEIVIERNPGYFRTGRPYLDRVVFRIVPSDQGLINQLLAGDLDFVRSISSSDAEKLRNRGRLNLVAYDDRAYTHICWNTTRPSLADAKVRTALTMAIDRETLIDVVYGGLVRIGVGPVLSTFWAFDRELEPLSFDPATATRLLGEAGWADTDGDGFVDRTGDDLTIELMAPAENLLRQDIAILVQQDLKRVGVRVVPRFVEWGTMMAAMRDGTFDGFINNWEEPTRVDLREIWHSPSDDGFSFNFGGYSNPEVDRLLDTVSELDDFEAQKPIIDQLQKLIVADQPYTFLVENVRLAGVAARIQGAEINAATPYFNIDQWYVTSEGE